MQLQIDTPSISKKKKNHSHSFLHEGPANTQGIIESK